MRRSAIISFLLTALLSHLCASGQQSDSLMRSVDIEEVSVRQRRPDNVGGMSTARVSISPSSARKLPSLMGNTDLLKVLELTPSLSTAGDMNTSIYVRGSEPGHNLMLYNEAPLYSSGHLLGIFPYFNTDHIGAFEMDATRISAAYGGRLSSVIKVNGKENIPPRPSVTGNAGLISSQLTLELPVGERFAAFLSGRKTYINLLILPLLNSTVDKGGSDLGDDMSYDFYDLNLTLLGKFSERSKLRVDLYQSEDKLGVEERDFLFDGNLKWTNRVATATWEKNVSRNLDITQTAFMSQSRNRLISEQGGMAACIDSEIMDAGYKNNYRLRLNNLYLNAGVQYTYHTIKPQGTQIRNVSTQYSSFPFPNYYSHEAGVYVSSDLHITKQLRTEAGVRYNLYIQGSKTFHSVEPRLYVNFEAAPGHNIRASYNRTNQYVNLLTTSSVGMPTDFWVSSGRSIPPQKNDQVTAGYYTVLGHNDWELSADVYYRSMSGLTEYNQELLGNVNREEEDRIFFGKGTSYGIEVMLQKKYGRLTGWFSYALGRSERKFPGINGGTKFPARFDRRHDLSMVANYTFNERWDISVVNIYATGNTYTLPESWYFINNAPVKQYGKYNDARLPAYIRTDVSVNYWFKKDNGINFTVYNLFAVTNPVYIFLHVKQDEDTGNIITAIKRKKLATIIPSLSWRFKF